MDEKTKKILAEVIQGVLTAENAANHAYQTAIQTYTALVALMPEFEDKYGEPTNLSFDSQQNEHNALQDRLGKLLQELQHR